MRKVDFALTRAFYIYGVLEAEGLLDENINSLEKIEAICINVADDWENRIDIRSVEEEGYPTAYVQRVLLEKYGRK
ncbi:hypothetical protein PQE75_gp042 [Bacillus phage vB_BcoS-136]|uniref:Uncharacterized protein n=1 Tax=Bacillus phage vB_BcoS-136 TaxID=2419619 RepID=A0A3G3BVD5_9CAUD|nr:hypothetical protein PQE75_gp042 [Bacillus phage vB_BcoS-136]AYP68174.1 hypothetical protein vBBcoS136_00042 [Bacillus phage vB_BcoS-136]